MRLIFLVLNIKRQTTGKKKNALHLELEWVKLAHFCHEFLPILLKIHSYINNFAIQNSGAKYKVVPSSALTGQWYGTYHTSGFVCKVLWDIDLNTHFRRDRVIEVSSSWKLIVPQTREYLKIYVPWHLTVKKQTNKWKQPTHRTFLTPFWCCFVLWDLFNSSLVALLFIGKYKHHNFLKKTSLKNISFPCVKHFLPHSLFLVLFYQIFVFTSCFFHGQQTIISAICYWYDWSFNSLRCILTSESKLCISISIYCSFCLIMKDTGGERTAQKASPIFLITEWQSS